MSLEVRLIELESYSAKAWRRYAAQDALLNLSFNEFDYLRVVKESGAEGIRITDLALEMSVTKPSASNMVAKLEKKGMVARTSCPEDARSKRIVLSSEVIESWALENVVYRDIAQKIRAKLTQSEAQQLEALLAKSLS
ncbi:MarR family winged helix-turn-helix transcriptional regulator [Vibrio agarivorans]|uniref:MarR family transcriptional regulator n=1 Tax=Vibrio agarivorans TaxID=153622 RepID=A0ABT7XX63_9VIBR|nr:MarR family transcriptional regulator [Vibrio agarivorans]MDN2480362.1 MarR family transcriptional regulator [Vibrio agarivorans]